METNGQQFELHKNVVRKIAARLTLAVVDVYLLGALAFMLVRTLGGQRFWPIEMLLNFLHWLLLPALLLVIVLVASRHWRRAGLAAAVSLVFLWSFGSLFLPNPPRACAAGPGSCTSIRVMSYNMFGMPHADYTAQIALIRDSGAHIIALQEVSEGGAAAIEAQLADVYPYRSLYPYGIPGTGMLSKYPILNAEAFQYRPDGMWHVRALIDVDGVPVTVISAHPPPPGWTVGRGYTSRGKGEIIELTAMTTQASPALLLGDFNIVDQSPDYRLLKNAGLRDAFREAGWGFGSTWPNGFRRFSFIRPMLRLDYIWYTGELRAVDAWVGYSEGSDHSPVFAELVLSH